ncbi:TSR1 [Enterospora canceri]|uniref:TSR1 n=1 Tax=Enterospora canceri TaxID=1081671 RepID=A0A1Y1S6P4_9MICR|nr:TSR1 [Enterospora canceri]
MLNYLYSDMRIKCSEMTVDNGIRIFSTKCITTGEGRKGAQKVVSGQQSGIVSFIGPVTLFNRACMVVSDENRFRVLFDCFLENRVFLNEKRLVGYPMKIFKDHVVVKGMFCNAEQVKYFRRIRLVSKNGNKGIIKRALGTKGLFKAQFDDQIRHGDEIAMKLYRRVYLDE